jgi:LacI family transcriptional regulator
MIERVRATAQELGYVASSAGRALRTGKSNVIGLVLPDIANPLFPKIAQAIEFAASNAGFGVLIGDSRGDVGMQTEAIGRLIERGVDAMIVVPRRGSRIVDVGCPVAVIDTPSTPWNTVSADHRQGGQLVAMHLAELGHRRIAIIGNNPQSAVQNDRVGGMRSNHVLSGEVLWTEKVDQNRANVGTLGLVALLERGVTAFATVSDLLALRVLTELHQAGVRIPQDASVTGFDNLVWAPVVAPALTTVHMDMVAIAEIAVAALVDAITAGHDQPRTPERTGTVVRASIDRVPMSLIVRQSSAPPPSGRPTTGVNGQ